MAETEAGADAETKANWYWAEAGKQNGPVAGSEIVRLVTDGRLRAEDMVWKEGMPTWVPVNKVPALLKYLPMATSVPPPVPAHLVAAHAAGVLAYQTAPIDRSGLHQYVHDPNAKVTCPHCSAINIASSQFCETCGMALPQPNFGPRIVDGSSFASTIAGQVLQSEELHKQAKRAAGALLAVAVIQTIFGAIIVGAAASNPRAVPLTQNLLGLSLIATAFIFWGLYIWARWQPLPAAIVGLVLYVTLKVIDLVVAITSGTVGQPNNRNGIGGTGISWVTIAIIVVLCQAISAGLKYRKMQASAASNVVG